MSKTDFESPRVFVGIGASAGGLPALTRLLPNLPRHDGYTYLVLQHLDPNHPTNLDSILSKHTELTVEQGADGQLMRPDHVYISPSNHDATVTNGTIHLRRATTGGPRHSVDTLFASIAQEHGSAAVGIILSGTGADGLQGAREIKGAGGLIAVQDPDDAEHRSMPATIIAAEFADIVLPASKLGPAIKATDRNQGLKTNLSITDAALRATLMQTLVQKTGFAFDQYKDTTIDRRIERRMLANQLDSLQDYLALVQQSEVEADLLLTEIQISVTRFFRDAPTFDAMTEAVRSLIALKRDGEPLRIWIPGCATGEEAFSIAMLIAETLGERLADTKVQLFATDIDTTAIAFARRCTYSKAACSDIPEKLFAKYFATVDDTAYTLKPLVRDLVIFAEHDLMRDPPFGRLDLISCRNVLIYFKRATQERLLKNFHYALNPGGYLALGSAESTGALNEFFNPADQTAKVYVAKDVRGSSPVFAAGARRPARRIRSVITDHPRSVDQKLRDAVFEQYAPPSILVNARLEVVHLSGELSHFLELPQGGISVNALDLVVAPLRLDLRLLMQKVLRVRTLVRTRPIAMRADGDQILVTLVALPVDLDADAVNHTLVLFETAAVSAPVAVEQASDEAVAYRIRELEQELIATREHLETNMVELEVSNEELQTSNEEAQSSTEELQSANEEFQTTNEELQSTNEELHTVNEELKMKTAELESAYSDLEGILNSVAEGIVVLDSALRVTRFSAGAQAVLNALPASIGGSLVGVGGPIDLSLLSKEIDSARRQNETVMKELVLGDSIFVVRVTPGKAGGIVISLTDETKRLKAGLESRRLAAVLRDSNDAITVHDTTGEILAWNRGAQRLYGYGEPEALEMNVRQLMAPGEAGLVEGYMRRLSAGETLEPFAASRLTKDGRSVSVWTTITGLVDEQGKLYAVGVTERDLTERLADALNRTTLGTRETEVRQRFDRLTPREVEIITLLVAGSADTSSRQIAQQLGISSRTVETHRRKINEKMRARSILELVELAKLCGVYRPIPK